MRRHVVGDAKWFLSFGKIGGSQCFNGSYYLCLVSTELHFGLPKAFLIAMANI